jgi:hypothetical protein
MNRRKAIGRIVLAACGGGLLFGGYRWYEIEKQPDLAYLEGQSPLLAALADTIIPPTPDSPGAAEAGVGPYIAIMLRDCTDRPSLNRFLDGLKDLVSYTRQHYAKPFQDCSMAERIAVLEHFEKTHGPLPGVAGKIEHHYLGDPFFTTLKHHTVRGYCTSEKGATKALAYVPIPQSYHGCIPITPGQKVWATK